MYTNKRKTKRHSDKRNRRWWTRKRARCCKSCKLEGREDITKQATAQNSLLFPRDFEDCSIGIFQVWPVNLTVDKTGMNSKSHLPTRPSRVLYGLASNIFVYHVSSMPLTNNSTEIFIKDLYIQTYSSYPKESISLESLDSVILLILSIQATDFLLQQKIKCWFFPSINPEATILHRMSITI